MKKNFTFQELKYRRALRAAQIFKDCYEEGSGCNSRLVEFLIPDEWAIMGVSRSGAKYREHIVPLALIRDIATKYIADGKSIEDVASFIANHYGIVRISFEEADYLDHELKLKSRMPDGWKVGDDIFARIKAANIKLASDIEDAA